MQAFLACHSRGVAGSPGISPGTVLPTEPAHPGSPRRDGMDLIGSHGLPLNGKLFKQPKIGYFNILSISPCTFSRTFVSN